MHVVHVCVPFTLIVYLHLLLSVCVAKRYWPARWYSQLENEIHDPCSVHSPFHQTLAPLALMHLVVVMITMMDLGPLKFQQPPLHPQLESWAVATVGRSSGAHCCRFLQLPSCLLHRCGSRHHVEIVVQSTSNSVGVVLVDE